MTRREYHIAAAGAFGALIAFLLCAFIAWDISPASWPTFGRLVCAAAMVMTGIFSAIGRSVHYD
ncbi:hypothetical protein [Sphingomonas sp.]|uniref:hypothetical protein n=1 Tax=Sphingomonas sp. TaxID=28214 RepID=UPI0025E9601D|nr:hypothetical protein [Sphingomonas sp.]